MSRRTERIIFMLTGAFIAFFAYIVGNFDNTTQAENNDDLGTYRNLLVVDTLVVGNPKGSHVLIKTDLNGNATISLNSFSEHEPNPKGGKVLMTADKNTGGSLMVSHAVGPNPLDDIKSIIWMTADEKEVANILMFDKDGRSDFNTRNSNSKGENK